MKQKLIIIMFLSLLPLTVLAAPANHSYYSTPIRIGGTDATPSTRLEVDGAMKIGNGAETCSAVAGAIRWDGTDFQGCNGTSWTSFSLDTTAPRTNITTNDTSMLAADTGSNGTISFLTEHFNRGSISNVGNLGVGTTGAVMKVEVNGSLKVGNGGETCVATLAGTMRYDTTLNRIEFCNGTDWQPL